MPQYKHHTLLAAALRCLTGVFLLSGAAAMAASETVTTGYYTKLSDDPTALVLPAFNSTLGTLEDINITLQVSLAPNIQVFNNTGAAIRFTDAGVALPIDFAGPADLEDILNLSYVNPSGIANPGLNTFTLCHGTTTFGSEIVDPSDFSIWEGTSTTKVNFAVNSGNPTFKGTAKGKGLFFGGNPAEWAKISVLYTYSSTAAVPEPSGRYLSFLVAGAMLLIVFRRRLRFGA